MKKEVFIEQGSNEWLTFRRSHRMASETPAIMGLCSYQSLYDIWSAKLGKVVYNNNPALVQGKEQESLARAAYESRYEPMRPAVYVDGDYGCSLDGINIEEDVILEIKTPYKGTDSIRWKSAEHGELIPADYAQVQHQLMVTRAKIAHFWVWDAVHQDGILIPVKPEPDYWNKIKTAWDDFWPTLTERKDDQWLDAASEYLILKQSLDMITKRMEAVKQKLFSLVVNDFSYGGGIEVRKIERAGNIDWQEVRKKYLADVDLEPFRKKGTSYYEITVLKKENNNVE